MSDAINAIRSFNRFYTNILGLHERHLLNSHFTLAEVRVMYEVMQATQVTASDLTTALNIDKGYLSRIIKKLEKHGLIHRTPAAHDRRKALIEMTPAGQQQFTQLNQASNQQIAELTQALEPSTMRSLVKHMEAIKSILGEAR